MSGLAPASPAPARLGSSIFKLGGAAGVATLLAPAANINGVIVRSLQIFSASGVGLGFLAKATAPVSSTDGNVIGVDASGSWQTKIPFGAVYIPPGLGLYTYNDNGTGGGLCLGTYDIL
jgi:hypothetical protein